ncbi:MAG: hypothetical protein AAF609_26170, partial [Cyanobacteria bacterium P01_C01_bin.120]
ARSLQQILLPGIADASRLFEKNNDCHDSFLLIQGWIQNAEQDIGSKFLGLQLLHLFSNGLSDCQMA